MQTKSEAKRRSALADWDFTCAVCMSRSLREFLHPAPSAGSLVVCATCGTAWRNWASFRSNGECFHVGTMPQHVGDVDFWLPPHLETVSFTRSEQAIRTRLRELGLTADEYVSAWRRAEESPGDEGMPSNLFYLFLLGGDADVT